MAQAGSLFFKLIPQMDSSVLAAEAKKAGQTAGGPLGQAMGVTASSEAGKALSASSRSMEQVAADMGTRVGTAIGRPLGAALSPVGTAITWAQDQFHRLPPVVQSTLSSIPTAAANAGRGMVDVISRSTAQATQTFSTWGQRLTAIVSAPVRLASNTFAQLGASIGAAMLVATGIDRISAIEQARVSLTTMLGDAQRANTLLDQVLAFARTTPFAFPDLATAARNMIAFGTNANDVIPILEAVGNAAAASGQGSEGLMRISGALGDIQVAGKLSMDQVNQLSAAGVPALQILANQAGVTAEVMRKRISDGSVSAKEAIAGLVKGIQDGTKGLAGETPKFAGLMNQLKGTWMGAVDSFKSAISSTMATILQPIMPRVEEAMGWFSEQFKKLPEALGFVKTAVQPIIDFITGPLLTAGRNLWDAFGPYITPLVQLVGVALVGAWRLLGDALNWFGGLLVSVTAWLKDHQLVVAIIAAAIGGYVAALTALNAITLAVRVATIAWAVAQGILNGVLALNPIGLVVAAIAALAAGLIYAYNHSETFRNAVQAAWSGIKTAAETAWNFLKGVFDALGAAISAVGGWFSHLGESAGSAWGGVTTALATGWQWLVDNVFTPMGNFFTVTIPAAWEALKNAAATVWNAIVEIVKVAVTLLLTIVLTPLVLFINEVIPGGMNTLLAIWTSVWEALKAELVGWWNFAVGIWNGIVTFATVTLPNAFGILRDGVVAAWNAIRDGINAAWQWILNNIWNPIVNFINTVLIPIFNVLRDGAVASWNAIRDGINAAWQWILNNIWNPIVNFITGTLLPKFDALRAGVIASWNAIRDGIQTVWNWIRDNIWNPLVTFITVTIPNAFQTGVDAVGRLWEKIKRALYDPINAVINVVWNQGIAHVWNMVANAVGLGIKLDENFHLGALAAGGPVRGGIPGKDSVPILAMPGEYVLSRSAVAGLGGLAVVDMINGMFGSGRRTGGIGFATGGSVAGASATGSASTVATGSVQATSVLGSWLGDITGALGKLAELVGGHGLFTDLMIGFGKKIGSAVVDFLTSKVAAFISSLVSAVTGGAAVPAGPIVQVVQQTAAQFGWGSGAQWDALVWIINHESGWNPNAQNPTSTAYGLFQFLNSTWGSTGIGKTSDPSLQALAGMRYIAQRYGSPVGAQSFWASHGWYDDGGVLPTGWSMAYNGTGRPETVLNADQFATLSRSTRGGDGALIGVLNLTVPQGASATEVVEELNFALRHSRRGLHARGRR